MLQPVPDTAGLWRVPDWAPGMPGLYALVIGVSAYPFLGGGTKEVEETYGLEQLVSSAQTAARLFQWLRNSYAHKELPTVWCRLLLSPTEAERKYLKAQDVEHFAEPTDSELRRSIKLWAGSLPSKIPSTTKSRTLFFFSGHGIQSNWHPLLLPSDYLEPTFGSAQLENCISAREMRRWMEENPVAEHLALIDACRNEFSPLASKAAAAHTSFPVNQPGGQPPRTVATLASTSPNAVAFQFPDQPMTLFGQALLEALRGGIMVSKDPKIEFLEVVDYVKPRVNALLKRGKQLPLEQTARPTVIGEHNLVVTELAKMPPDPPFMRPTTVETSGLRARFDASLEVRDPIELGVLRDSFDEAHRRFGHEYVAGLWCHHGLLRSMRDGAPVKGDGAATIISVRRDEASSVVQVDLKLEPDEHGLLLVFGGDLVQRERLALALPTDPMHPLPVRLTLWSSKGSPGEQPVLQKVDTRLGPSEQNEDHQYLWTITQQADYGSLRVAARNADLNRLKRAVECKRISPTAATAGALVLWRGGRLEDVGDWTRNLAHWFGGIPDGFVLWGESLRAAIVRGDEAPYGVSDPLDQLIDALRTMRERGLPFFSDAFELAQSLSRWVLRMDLSQPLRDELDELRRWLDVASEVAMPGSQFLALAGRPRPAALGPSEDALNVEELWSLLRPG